VVTCPTCGRENPEDARFCSTCGTPLDVEPASGVRKIVTVVFCDLVGSTALGERTDPEVLRELMSRYHGELRAILERNGGTVEKFVGDAAMAVFGLPQPMRMTRSGRCVPPSRCGRPSPCSAWRSVSA
jgi:class 3 adenylate cyclase